MQHPYDVLAPEYATLLTATRVDAGREHELAARAAAVRELGERHRDEWAEVTAKTGVPRLWGLASFERESGSDYSRSAAQGDRWDRVSVDVLRGLGLYADWGAAYAIDKLNEVGAPNWIWSRACYEGELYNGFGPRAHGRRIGYLWSWTNLYTGGKYAADGKWDPDTQDQQCGMVPMMAALLRLDATLARVDGAPALPSRASRETEGSTCRHLLACRSGLGAGPAGGNVTTWLQASLNRLGANPPLVVDGCYGRHTRRAVTAFQTGGGAVAVVRAKRRIP